jgi:Arc/MetJ-type ribon-helix-helix transcriptional regulator
MAITLALPQPLEDFVTRQAAASGYADARAYVEDLIRDAQRRSHLEARLLAGVEALDRGEGRELAELDWQRLLARYPTTAGEEQ